MHFTGQIWRPPTEAKNALLQVTSGCMHNKCKFCSLYYGTPFRMSPLVEIEMDLAELKKPFFMAKRVFLTGANPLGLSYNKLVTIGEKIKAYLPHVESIGGFARISDIKNKTQDELNELHSIGYNDIPIGTETGDDETLAYMNKGYTASDIVEQLHRLDNAGIKYHLTYMNGLAGTGNSERHALESAKIFNQSNPQSIGIVGLTIFPEAELYKEVQAGTYTPASETEKLYELKSFIKNLDITTTINASTVSNTAPFIAELPKDKEDILEALQGIIERFDEACLSNYRNSIVSL
jgi:radical SAM superfamily enzyme YgiQ (UPF0313 family)